MHPGRRPVPDDAGRARRRLVALELPHEDLERREPKPPFLDERREALHHVALPRRRELHTVHAHAVPLEHFEDRVAESRAVHVEPDARVLLRELGHAADGHLPGGAVPPLEGDEFALLLVDDRRRGPVDGPREVQPADVPATGLAGLQGARGGLPDAAEDASPDVEELALVQAPERRLGEVASGVLDLLPRDERVVRGLPPERRDVGVVRVEPPCVEPPEPARPRRRIRQEPHRSARGREGRPDGHERGLRLPARLVEDGEVDARPVEAVRVVRRLEREDRARRHDPDLGRRGRLDLDEVGVAREEATDRLEPDGDRLLERRGDPPSAAARAVHELADAVHRPARRLPRLRPGRGDRVPLRAVEEVLLMRERPAQLEPDLSHLARPHTNLLVGVRQRVRCVRQRRFRTLPEPRKLLILRCPEASQSPHSRF